MAAKGGLIATPLGAFMGPFLPSFPCAYMQMDVGGLTLQRRHRGETRGFKMRLRSKLIFSFRDAAERWAERDSVTTEIAHGRW